MSIVVNLQNYIDLAKERHKAHQKEALCWDWWNNFGNVLLIILTATATVLSVLEKYLPIYIVPIFTGLAVIVSSLIAVFKPFDKRNNQEESSKKFKVLMLELVDCKSIEDYHSLKAKVLETILDEPFTKAEGKEEKKRNEIEQATDEALRNVDEDSGKSNQIQKCKQRFVARERMELDADARFWPLDYKMRRAAIIEEIRMQEFLCDLVTPKNVQQTVQQTQKTGDIEPKAKTDTEVVVGKTDVSQMSQISLDNTGGEPMQVSTVDEVVEDGVSNEVKESKPIVTSLPPEIIENILDDIPNEVAALHELEPIYQSNSNDNTPIEKASE